MHVDPGDQRKCLAAALVRQAEQLIFDYFAKLADTRQDLEVVRAPGLRPFPEYGDFIQGVLTHEDDLAAIGQFLAGYAKCQGKA